RFGPSMMPGGDPESWKYLKPIWEAVAAKVDAKTGKPLENYAPRKPVTGGVPCTAYIGPNGAGHYVKMVHNGIEYIDMQLICEAYTLMQNLLGMTPPQMSKVLAQWNEGDLDSYLIQITADIRDALYCSKICAYAQGFQLMREAQKEYNWKLNFAEIAAIWRGGCIIRACFLQKITDAYTKNANLVNLLLDPYFNEQIKKAQ